MASIWAAIFPNLDTFINKSEENKQTVAGIMGPMRKRGIEYELWRQDSMTKGLLVELTEIRAGRKKRRMPWDYDRY